MSGLRSVSRRATVSDMTAPENLRSGVRMTDLSSPPLLAVRNLKTYFPQDEGTVKAVDGASFELHPGRVLICPGSRHMKVKRLPLGDVVVLCDEPRVNGHRPSADVLLRSVAEEFKTNAVGVLMTGMGDDGAEGLGAIKKQGGMTIAQSEDSCVVCGMPKAAIERGYAIRVIGLHGMGAALQTICGRNTGSSNGFNGRAMRAGN